MFNSLARQLNLHSDTKVEEKSKVLADTANFSLRLAILYAKRRPILCLKTATCLRRSLKTAISMRRVIKTTATKKFGVHVEQAAIGVAHAR